LIALEATITNEESGSVGSKVRIYGVDQRFWAFHGRTNEAPTNREILLSATLATELGSSPGDSLIVRVQKPSDIPIESLHSRKEDLGRTLRLTMRKALSIDDLGEFSVQPQQGAVRAAFVPLNLLQIELGQPGKVNLMLLSEKNRAEQQKGSNIEELSKILKDKSTLEDYGVQVRALESQSSISVEHDSKIFNDALADVAIKTANSSSLHAMPVFSYLANSIRTEQHSIPYSLVSAIDDNSFEKLVEQDASMVGRPAVPSNLPSPLVLNEWAARDLGVNRGATVTLEYYYWNGAISGLLSCGYCANLRDRG
jgi:putative ABC transport system permease protein